MSSREEPNRTEPNKVVTLCLFILLVIIQIGVFNLVFSIMRNHEENPQQVSDVQYVLVLFFILSLILGFGTDNQSKNKDVMDRNEEPMDQNKDSMDQIKDSMESK